MSNSNNKNLTNSLLAITSSIITSILQNIIFTSHYEEYTVDNKTVFIKVSKLNTIEQLISVIFIFFLTWFVIGYIIPKVYLLVKRKLKFKTKKSYSVSEIVKTYNDTKDIILKFDAQYNLQSKDTYCKSINLLAVSEILICINKLHKVLYKKNDIQANSVNDAFRNETTVNDIGNKISKYEFDAIIEVISTILDSSLEHNSNDYKNLSKKIDDLREVYK